MRGPRKGDSQKGAIPPILLELQDTCSWHQNTIIRQVAGLETIFYVSYESLSKLLLL